MRGYYKENESGELVFIPSGEMPNQQVGIYWFIDNEVIKDAVPFKDGEPYGEVIQYGSHFDFWQALQPTTEIEKKLKSHAYDAYPRGRIVFFPARKVFRIYSDHCLDTDDLNKVLESFEIEDFDIEIKDDEHYRCAGCNPFYVDI
ncbi:MAG: hypothetical protein CVU71_07165 [Deltaproteobacteria bacterium HGW-Deltaproteobacteria-6]|jgi:hypothetical protein|nr:MAG: hypothetical protein CVU71_07165 [Deltaproteobacteria bacterium HGW-Deltaproteobacteria-6]